MADISNKKSVPSAPVRSQPAGMKISRLTLGVEGNGIINLITIAVLIILAVWAYFVFDFLNRTCATMRDISPAQRQSQNLRIDVNQAKNIVGEIEQGKLY